MRGLHVEGLRVAYGELVIVHDLDLAVEPGELAVIVGPNGAGKSTALKGIAGLVPPRAGTVMIGDHDVTDLPAHEKVGYGIAVVPQIRNIFERLTVQEHLDVAIGASGRGRVDEALRLVPQIETLLKRRAGQLSGGQRQLVAMARALVTEPRVLLLDEPTAGVQPNTAKDLLDHVKHIADEGVAVLMVEQNARSAMRLADKAIVLDRGRVAFEGGGPELLANPDVGRLYLGGAVGGDGE